MNNAYDDATRSIRVSGGGASTADGATFTSGTTAGSIIEGVYQATPTAVADGKAGAIRISANRAIKTDMDSLLGGEDLTNNVMGTLGKPVASATYSPSLYTAITQVTKANIKAAAGNVTSCYITNTNAAVRYFQLHNKATAPAATEVPIYSIPIPAGSATVPGVLPLDEKFFSQGGHYFSTGIGWAVSTTYATFTDSATNTEHIPVIHYV